MSKDKKGQAQTPTFEDLEALLRAGKQVVTTTPYIPEASITHELPAHKANDRFRIVLPQMADEFEGVAFLIRGAMFPISYIEDKRLPYKPHKDTEDLITRDRLNREFTVGEKVVIWPYLWVGGQLAVGSRSKEITITRP